MSRNSTRLSNATLCSNIESMRAGHVMAAVFSLSVCLFPVPFALAQAEQITGTLLEQITGMDIGAVELGTGNDFTITRRDGSRYVFENVKRHDSAASAVVYLYDANGTLTDTVAFDSGIQVVDDNRIDFEAQITSAGMDAITLTGTTFEGQITSGGKDATLSGSLTGLKSKTYTAVGSINEAGESRAFIVDYSGIAETKSLSSLITLTSMDDAARVCLMDDIIIVVVVVLFVAVTCLLFGWWGC